MGESLGTTALSGTKAFMAALLWGGGIALIENFCLGVFSRYIDADSVTIASVPILRRSCPSTF